MFGRGSSGSGQTPGKSTRGKGMKEEWWIEGGREVASGLDPRFMITRYDISPTLHVMPLGIGLELMTKLPRLRSTQGHSLTSLASCM